jgi:hypothetical protein
MNLAELQPTGITQLPCQEHLLYLQLPACVYRNNGSTQNVGRMGREDEESLGWSLMEKFIARRYIFLIWKWSHYHKIKKGRIEAYNVIPTATSLFGSIYLWGDGGLKLGSPTPNWVRRWREVDRVRPSFVHSQCLVFYKLKEEEYMGLIVVDGREKAETIRQIHRFLL